MKEYNASLDNTMSNASAAFHENAEMCSYSADDSKEMCSLSGDDTC